MTKHRPDSYFVKNSLRNNRGSTIMMVLGISAFIAIATGFIADRLIVQKKLADDLNSNVSYTIAIQSVTDFAKHALKQKWCFDDPTNSNSSLTPDAAANCAGNYTHPQSLTRLTLPLKFARKLAEYKCNYPTLINSTFPGWGTSNPPNSVCDNSSDPGVILNPAAIRSEASNMLLSSFTVQGTVANLPSSHPLKQILLNAKGKQVIHSVSIKYEVISDINLPSAGDEVYVKITTTLYDDSAIPQVIKNGAFKASEINTVYVAPRELNYFSLVLRGNLILGQTSANANTGTDGHGYIPSTSASDAGVSFYGPVFINKNLILPDSVSTKSNTTFYEPVTFGSGFIGQNSSGSTTGYTSATALGDNREWNDTGLFGGFLKGFENDSASDAGFDSLSGVSGGSAASNTLVAHCINRIREKNNPSATLSSQLYAQSINVGGVKSASTGQVIRKFNIAFLKNNNNNLQKRFYPQTGTTLTGNVGTPALNDTSGIIEAQVLTPTSSGSTPRAVSMMVDIGFSGKQRLNIPLPDQVGSSDGVTEISLKSSATDIAKVTLRVEDYKIGGVSQPHIRTVTVTVDDIDKLIDHPGGNIKHPIEYLKIRAMDNTCTGGVCIGGTNGSGNYKDIYLKKFTTWIEDSNIPTVPGTGATPPVYGTPSLCSDEGIYNQWSYMQEPQCQQTAAGPLHKSTITLPIAGYSFPSLTEDIGTLDNQCQSAGNTNLSSYNATATEQYYTDHSVEGWEFVNAPDPVTSQYPDITFTVFNSTNSVSAAMYNRCIVPSSVFRVVGNFVCRRLIIQARSSTLQMIGTFVVVDKLHIDQSAMTNGVSFMSVHNPVAVNILKDSMVLKTSDGSSCDSLPTPHWHPDPGISTLSNRISCSPLSTLKNGSPEKFPFRWTSVSADCVRYPASTSDTLCMKKIRNYFYKDLERQYAR